MILTRYASKSRIQSFNARALHTVRSLGFERVGAFNATYDGRQFEVLVRREHG